VCGCVRVCACKHGGGWLVDVLCIFTDLDLCDDAILCDVISLVQYVNICK
jgi:hypothetical protein